MSVFTSKVWRIQEFGEHAARAEQPYVSFRRVDAPRSSPPPRPIFAFGPMGSSLARQLYAQTELRATGCFIIRDAFAGPTGVVVKEGHAFWSDALNHHRPYVQTVVQRVNTGELPTRDVDGPLVAFLGPAYEVYGHFLIDYLPKLWLLEACGFKISRLRFLVPLKPPQWVLDFLQAAGIQQVQLVPYQFGQEMIRTNTLVVPTIMRTYERLSQSFGTATRFWVDRVRAQLPQAVGLGQRIFVSRANGERTRRFTNRQAIEHAAEQHGYVVFRPETLSLAEQVAAFASARHVVGEYGSGLHNTVFSQPGTTTCALRGTLRDPGSIQSSLSEALDQKTGYVIGQTVGDDRNHDVTVAAEDFQLAMAAMHE